MKNITAQELMQLLKLGTIYESKKNGDIAVPTMICFVYHKDGDIYAYTTRLYEMWSFTDLKDYINNHGFFEEYMSPSLWGNGRYNLPYNVSSFDANTLLKDLESSVKEWNFPYAKYFQHDGDHFYWVGHHIDYPISTIEDVEKYCYDSIVESIEQYEKHYKDELYVLKDNEKVIFTEKIEKLTPYWGESGFDCLYINSSTKDGYLDEGFSFRMSMSIEGTEYIVDNDEWFYGRNREEVILIFYRVCAKLERDFTNPMISHNCIYYPCMHGIYEDFVEEYRNLAKKYLNLSTQEYLEKCNLKS